MQTSSNSTVVQQYWLSSSQIFYCMLMKLWTTDDAISHHRRNEHEVLCTRWRIPMLLFLTFSSPPPSVPLLCWLISVFFGVREMFKLSMTNRKTRKLSSYTQHRRCTKNLDDKFTRIALRNSINDAWISIVIQVCKHSLQADSCELKWNM